MGFYGSFCSDEDVEAQIKWFAQDLLYSAVLTALRPEPYHLSCLYFPFTTVMEPPVGA